MISHTFDCPLASCPYPHQFSHHPWLACSLCPPDFVPADPPGPTQVEPTDPGGDLCRTCGVPNSQHGIHHPGGQAVDPVRHPETLPLPFTTAI